MTKLSEDQVRTYAAWFYWLGWTQVLYFPGPTRFEHPDPHEGTLIVLGPGFYGRGFGKDYKSSIPRDDVELVRWILEVWACDSDTALQMPERTTRAEAIEL